MTPLPVLTEDKVQEFRDANIHSSVIAEFSERAAKASRIRDTGIALADHWLRTRADGWQPIETAPLHYTPVMLFDPQGATGEGWYSSHLKAWEFANPQHVMRRNPTHWRPLPDAPPQEPA